MSEFNKKNLDFDKRYSEYTKIDQYAQQNPDWWKYVSTQFNNRNNFNPQNVNPANPPANPAPANSPSLPPEFQTLKGEFETLKKDYSEILAERQERQKAKSDEALKGEIESIRKQYSNLDFNTPDVNGKSLEYKVLEHAHQNNIGNFKTAFLDFYHDELMKMAKTQAKEELKTEVQKNSKLGLLGQKNVQAPTEKLTSAKRNMKNYSYEDGLNEAMEELGLKTSNMRG